MPDPIVPVPARLWPDIRGERVIVGRADLGWRGDLRADSPVTQDGRTFVPVLTEHDWYRSEAEQIEVFAPLVPASRVWVETVQRGLPPDDDRAPVVRRAVPIDEVPWVVGRRVVCLAPGAPPAFHRARRAVSEVYRTADQSAAVLVVTEIEWYRWTWTGRTPKAMEMPAEQVWIE
jgi:hypothetical protein